jgi:quinol monooxygenase YgiN
MIFPGPICQISREYVSILPTNDAIKRSGPGRDSMRFFRIVLLACAVMAGGFAPPARAQAPPAPGVYAVTYFEIAPNAARKAAGLLRPFAEATRKEDGNAELTVLHEIGRPGRFALIEAWRDKAALDAHGAAMKALGDKLAPIFASPFDARTFLPMSIAPPAAGADLGGAVYVLTHVDVFPAGKDDVAAMLKQLADDSRKDGGSQRFDAVIQDERPNHFHLIEAWSDRKAREAHALTDHTKAFRAKLVPYEGAL